jgi:hypothetical protein
MATSPRGARPNRLGPVNPVDSADAAKAIGSLNPLTITRRW